MLTEDNRPISGSHITDLINTAIWTQRKIRKLPTGWGYFYQKLREANIPERLLGGPQFQPQQEVWKPEPEFEPESEPKPESEWKPKIPRKKYKMGEYIKGKASFDLKDFYLHLPSNTNHTGNTAGEFIVPVAQPYELVGEWELGLMEIQYARMWYNVPSDQFVQVGNTTILIPDMKELIKILNKIKLGLGGNSPVTVEFKTIEATQKTRLKIARNDSSEELSPDLYLSKRLSNMLGLVKSGPFSAGDRKSK